MLCVFSFCFIFLFLNFLIIFNVYWGITFFFFFFDRPWWKFFNLICWLASIPFYLSFYFNMIHHTYNGILVLEKSLKITKHKRINFLVLWYFGLQERYRIFFSYLHLQPCKISRVCWKQDLAGTVDPMPATSFQLRSPQSLTCQINIDK